MSGSSLDGLDIVYCTFRKAEKWQFEILYHEIYAISCWEDRLKNVRFESEIKLAQLDEAFGGFIGEKINAFIAHFQIEKIDIIASHGHTVYHFPEKGITKQIGLGKMIFQATKIPTLTNLRQNDMDAGGQGAPIVPIGDLHLFANFTYCLNLGGIANISIKKDDQIMAFDICTANQVLNYFAFLKGIKYDENGDLAKAGNCNQALLDDLNNLDFHAITGPKSLDNLYTETVLKTIKQYPISIEDKLHTYVKHIAFQIKNSITKYKTNSKKEQILITGGGAFNQFLILQIQEMLTPLQIEIIIPDQNIINYKEALVMAFMGVRYLRNEVNCLASVTGAQHDSICGEYFG